MTIIRKIILSVFLTAATAAGGVQAQDFVQNVSNKGTVAAAFLEIGIGARAEAMGGAYAAESGRAEMIYWNPAGLAYIQGAAATATHARWLADTNFDFVGVAVPMPFFNTVLGASFTTLAVPEQEVRTVESPDGTNEFYDARDIAVNVAISSRLIDVFSVGVSGKYIHQRIWTETATQVAFDVGVYYRTPLDGLQIGSSISNVGNDLRLTGRHLNDIIDPDRQNFGVDNIPVLYKTDPAPLPQIFRFGLAYETQLPGSGRLVSLVDLMHPTGSTESVSFGLEYGFNELLFLRAGYQNLYERDHVNGLTLGGGVQLILPSRSRFQFDYAWSDWGVLSKVHRVSAGIYM